MYDAYEGTIRNDEVAVPLERYTKLIIGETLLNAVMQYIRSDTYSDHKAIRAILGMDARRSEDLSIK